MCRLGKIVGLVPTKLPCLLTTFVKPRCRLDESGVAILTRGYNSKSSPLALQKAGYCSEKISRNDYLPGKADCINNNNEPPKVVAVI